VSKITGEEMTEIIRQNTDYHLRKIVKKNEEKKPIYPRLSDQGLGIYKLVLLVMWLSAIKPRLVLIDDLELASHISLIKYLINYLINELKSQVIISTHSIDVINSVVDLYVNNVIAPEEAQVILLNRADDDVLHVNHIDIHEVYAMMSAGHDPRKISEVFEL